MTAILTKLTTVEEAAAGRPGWTTPRPTVALRTVFLSGTSFTQERWAVVEAGVQHDGRGQFAVVVTRYKTRSGWSGHTKVVIGRELRSTVAEALALADGLVDAVVEHDGGGTA